MNIIEFKQQDFNNLERFFPKTTALGIESRLHLYKNNNKIQIIKEFKKMNYNKLLTINLINYYKDDINISELVLENDLATINNIPIGTVTEYIEGKVLSNIIYDKNISIIYKIDLLKKIGFILDKMKTVRNNGITDFYIGDLHDDNIIVTPDNNIKIFDMDSSKIMYNETFPSKYLTRYARKMKYDNCLITPTEYTDNYCFNMMILNTLFSKDISKLKIIDFYRHIDYLKSIGVDINLIYNFESIYNDITKTKNFYKEIESLKKYEKLYLK